MSRKILAELRQKNIIYEKSGLIKLPEIETETLFRGVVEGSDLLSSDQVKNFMQNSIITLLHCLLYHIIPHTLKEIFHLLSLSTRQ